MKKTCPLNSNILTRAKEKVLQKKIGNNVWILYSYSSQK